MQLPRHRGWLSRAPCSSRRKRLIFISHVDLRALLAVVICPQAISCCINFLSITVAFIIRAIEL